MNDVSFSERVKYELCSLDISNVSEARAELIGFIKARGVLRISKEASTVSVTLPDIRVGRRFLKLMDYLSVGEHETTIVQPRRLWNRKTVEFNLPIDSVEIFKDNLTQQLPAEVLDDTVLFGTFLRGVYLSCGSMVDPSISYHMEISNSSQELLEQIRGCLKANFGIESKTVRFRNSYKLSIRRATDLIEFLNLIGAVESALRVEEIVQKRSVASDVNRSMNFLSANADRIGISTVKQVRAIEVIDRTLGIDSLEDDLKKLARLRIENEDLSLRELGEMMEPKMSKSMVYARMKKIIQLAERIERGQNR